MLGPFTWDSDQDRGTACVFSTSQKYPAAITGRRVGGVEIVDGVTVATGVSGRVEVDCTLNDESAESKVEGLLAGNQGKEGWWWKRGNM